MYGGYRGFRGGRRALKRAKWHRGARLSSRAPPGVGALSNTLPRARSMSSASESTTASSRPCSLQASATAPIRSPTRATSPCARLFASSELMPSSFASRLQYWLGEPLLHPRFPELYQGPAACQRPSTYLRQAGVAQQRHPSGRARAARGAQPQLVPAQAGSPTLFYDMPPTFYRPSSPPQASPSSVAAPARWEWLRR